MDEKDCCYNGGNKHKFTPRYSEKDVRRPIACWGYTPTDQVRKLRIFNIYECDICEWCGKKD